MSFDWGNKRPNLKNCKTLKQHLIYLYLKDLILWAEGTKGGWPVSHKLSVEKKNILVVAFNPQGVEEVSSRFVACTWPVNMTVKTVL